MADRRLHLTHQPSDAAASTCRTGGCANAAADELRFCPSCRHHYDARRRASLRRVAVAVALVRAAHPHLFERLDRTPPLGDRLATHLAAYASPDAEGSPALSLQGLDDFLRETSDRRSDQ